MTTESYSDVYFHVNKQHTLMDHAVVSDDPFHSPCWQSLTTTTCRWCAPTQLALIQTWDTERNIRHAAMSFFSSVYALWVVMTKLIKLGAGSRVSTNTRTLRKEVKSKSWFEGRSPVFSYRFHTSLPGLSIPPKAFGEKKCQMITLLWAPSGSSCTYNSAAHISHFPASPQHYSGTLNPLFCRGSQEGLFTAIHFKQNIYTFIRGKYVSNVSWKYPESHLGENFNKNN